MVSRPSFFRIISIALFAGGVLLTVCGFISLKKEDSVSAAPFLIPYDKGNFVLRYQSTCIASVTTNIKNDSSGLNVIAVLDVVRPDQTVVTMNGELSFNELNQMFGAVFKVASAGQKLTVGSTGVDPLAVQVKGQLFDHPFELAFPMPGPVRLKKETAGYRLLFPKSSHRMTENFAAPGISLEPVAVPVICPPLTSIPSVGPESIVKLLQNLKERVESK